jgi:hypothetical protein
MTDIEKRARELLVTLLKEQHGWVGALAAEALGESPANVRISGSDAIKAVVAALTPPEGYVLVPVEPTEAMLQEIHLVKSFTGEAMHRRYAAMIAARPEVLSG